MTTRHCSRFGVVAAAVLFTFAVSAGPALAAEDSGSRFPPPPPDQKGQKQQQGQKKKKKQSQEQLREGYQHARALIMDGQYEAGIAAMHALGHDDNPEIANFIGYASRKLGRYEDSKFWYEKALAADPNHVRTWSYYVPGKGAADLRQHRVRGIPEAQGRDRGHGNVLKRGVRRLKPTASAPAGSPWR